MNIASLVSQAEQAGIRFVIVGNSVKVRGDATAIKAYLPSLSRHKEQILAHLQGGSESNGEFWPWMPRIGVNDVARFRSDLVGMIERLADIESWTPEDRDDVLARAVRGPLSDLLPNVAHFHERLTEATAAAAAREAVEKRTWRFDR